MRVRTLLMLCLASAGNGWADMHYVDLNSTNPTPPYRSWATAATNIQDAVDAATAGDEIIVTNGTYEAGGTTAIPLGSCVTVTNAVTLRSVNGPDVTTIVGNRYGWPMRCVYLANGASLSGFTLTAGFTLGPGGGVYCESQMALVSDCILSSNVCLNGESGGGASGGTLNNCSLIGNMAYSGGGAANCILNGCFLSGNLASGEPGVGGAPSNAP